MLKIYKTDIETNRFEEIEEFEKGSWINLVNPSDSEIKRVCKELRIQDGFIKTALDNEEQARIDVEEDDEDILEDAIIENKQAIEMAKIYSDILNGTMDAYASIISNNLNGVMKFLTSITIILAVPTMVSSFWGMNVGLPLQNSSYGFAIMLVISIVLTLLVTWWLKRKDMLD